MSDQESLLHSFTVRTKGVEVESAAMGVILSELELHKQKLKAQAAQNWKESDQLAFNLLGNATCYQQYLTETTNSRLLLAFDLLRIGSATVNPNKRVSRLAAVLTTHGGQECELVALAEIALHFQQSGKLEVDYATVLPLVLRALASVLQRYLDGKQDKVNSSQDRLETDLPLHQHCERWVSELLVRLLRAISRVGITTYPSRKYFLNVCCDSVEALLRNILDHTLNEEIVGKTLSALVEIVKGQYALTQIIEEQTRLLRINHAHAQPLHQLEVPKCYKIDEELNRAGVAYLISKYLEAPAATKFYNRWILTKALVLATAEALSSSYPFKDELLKRLSDHFLADTSTVKSNFELNYPYSVLCERLFTVRTEEPKLKETAEAVLRLILVPVVASDFLARSQSKHAKLLIEWLNSDPDKSLAFTGLLSKLDQKHLDQPSRMLIQGFLNR